MTNYDEAVKALEEIIKRSDSTKEIESIKALIDRYEMFQNENKGRN